MLLVFCCCDPSKYNERRSGVQKYTFVVGDKIKDLISLTKNYGLEEIRNSAMTREIFAPSLS
jgi:hypothetical protein